MIADRAFFRDQFDGVLPVLAFSSDMIYRLMPLFEAAGLQERMLSRVASNIIEAGGDATLHEALTKKYRDRTSYLVRLMPDLQHDRDHVRDKFGNVEVYLASSIEQYWTAPLGVKEVRSKVSEGYAFLESDYAGDLRIYLKTGYDAEPFPIELADRLTEFFNIPETKKDLVNVVLTASVDRLDRLFDEKGIPPLLEEIPERPEADFEDPPEDVALARSQTSREEKPKSKLGSSENSRFTRLLAHKRFNSSTSGFSDINQSISSLPSYNTAIGNPSKLGSSSKLDEKKQKSIVPVFYTLEDVEKTLKDMRFQQHKGIVKAKLPEPQGLLERVKNYVQRDNDAAELVVSPTSFWLIQTRANESNQRCVMCFARSSAKSPLRYSCRGAIATPTRPLHLWTVTESSGRSCNDLKRHREEAKDTIASLMLWMPGRRASRRMAGGSSPWRRKS